MLPFLQVATFLGIFLFLKDISVIASFKFSELKKSCPLLKLGAVEDRVMLVTGKDIYDQTRIHTRYLSHRSNALFPTLSICLRKITKNYQINCKGLKWKVQNIFKREIVANSLIFPKLNWCNFPKINCAFALSAPPLRRRP